MVTHVPRVWKVVNAAFDLAEAATKIGRHEDEVELLTRTIGVFCTVLMCPDSAPPRAGPAVLETRRVGRSRPRDRALTSRERHHEATD